jgi:DNA-binding MarR family transcriptional regulator
VPKTTIDQDLASQLRLAVTRLNRRLRQHSVDDDLSATALATLATVERSGPISLGELAAIERVQPPSMTRIVTGLEEQGFVRREPSPTDRRVAFARITPAGVAALQRTRRRRTAYLAARLRKLSSDELRTLEDALPVLQRLIQDEA